MDVFIRPRKSFRWTFTIDWSKRTLMNNLKIGYHCSTWDNCRPKRPIKAVCRSPYWGEQDTCVASSAPRRKGILPPQQVSLRCRSPGSCEPVVSADGELLCFLCALVLGYSQLARRAAAAPLKPFKFSGIHLSYAKDPDPKLVLRSSEDSKAMGVLEIALVSERGEFMFGRSSKSS